MSNLLEINELFHKFLKSICRESYHLFFSCLSFLTTLEALEIIVLPAPSYNQHQQLFVEKLTDYPQVIGQKITVYKISPQLFIFFLSGKQLIMIISWVRQGKKRLVAGFFTVK